MSFLVWIRRNGQATPQLWTERSYAMDRRAEAARIVERVELPERHRGLPFADLVLLHPCPEMVS
jgi:hypothetical protein